MRKKKGKKDTDSESLLSLDQNRPYNSNYPPPQGAYPLPGQLGYNYGQEGFNYGQPGYNHGPQGGGMYPPPQQPTSEQVQYVYPPGAADDPESQDSPKNFDFDDQSIRKGFIRKVYMILMAQLLVTFGFVALFVYEKNTQEWAYRNTWLVWVALAILLVTMISMACCEGVRRKTPMNFIFLALFTLAESFLLGVTSSVYAPNEVLMAIGITAAVCLALTLFAFQTKWDFTVCGGVLLVAIVVFLIFGIVAIFIPGKIMTLVYASLGALLFSIYLVYDTQLMIGGNHKYSISPEEYIFAALNLYLDIVNIFMYILAIIGVAKS